MVERAPLPQHPNIPGPLAFDQKGRLHHVYVVSTAAVGGRATRSLVHRWREPSGEWRDEIAVSVHAGPMNAHIGLALIPDDQPVVLLVLLTGFASGSGVCAALGRFQDFFRLTVERSLVPIVSR